MTNVINDSLNHDSEATKELQQFSNNLMLTEDLAEDRTKEVNTLLEILYKTSSRDQPKEICSIPFFLESECYIKLSRQI